MLSELLDKFPKEKYFKLSTTLSISNIYLFNYKGIITKYDNVLDIIEEFYEYRLEMYVKRKKYYIRILENELMIFMDAVMSKLVSKFTNK